MRQRLSSEEKAELRGFLRGLDAFTRISNTMPMQYVRSFCLVALDEGLGVNEYAEAAGVPQSVMSRHLLDIGERNRHKEEGFGLVTSRTDPWDLRKHLIVLTDKGVATASAVIRGLR